MPQLRRSYKSLCLYVVYGAWRIDRSLFFHSSLALGLWHLNWLSWTRFFLGVFVTWWLLHTRDWEALVKDWYCGKLLVWLWFRLCGRKEMPKFFRIRQGLQRFFGVQFIFLFSFWVSYTTTFQGIPFNAIQLDWLWFVGPKVWASKGRLFCMLSLWCVGLLSILEVPFVLFFVLGGFLILLLYLLNPYLIYNIVVSHKKKKVPRWSCSSFSFLKMKTSMRAILMSV